MSFKQWINVFSFPATNHKTHIYGYSNTWHYPMSFWFYMWCTAHYSRRARKDVLTITRILSNLLNLKTLWFLICTNLFPLAHTLVQTVRWLVGLWSLSNIQERTLRIKPTLRLRVKWDFIQYALTLLIVGKFISNKKMYFILCLFFLWLIYFMLEIFCLKMQRKGRWNML